MRDKVHKREYDKQYRRTHEINYSPEALDHRKEYSRTHIAHLRKNDPNYSKHSRRHRKHHYSHREYDALLVKQDGVCPICKKPLILTDDYTGESPTLDHNHSCCPGVHSCGKCIRGILHARCNNALGCVDDNPVALRNAAEYLDQSSAQ